MQIKNNKYKKLIIISSCADNQSLIWYDLCRSIGAETVCLYIEDYQIKWDLYVSGFSESVEISYDNMVLYGNDKNTCWYIRSINEGSAELLSSLNMLHSILSLHSYPMGNYFFKGDEEGRLEAKPLHAAIVDLKFPKTNVLNFIDTLKPTSNRIVKSISTKRSEVVSAIDSRLKIVENSKLPTPVMLQDNIHGIPVKLHFYRKRCGSWMPFSISCNPSKNLDYRYDLSKYSANPFFQKNIKKVRDTLELICYKEKHAICFSKTIAIIHPRDQ